MNRKFVLPLLPLLAPGIAFAAVPPATYQPIAPIGTLSGVPVTLSKYLKQCICHHHRNRRYPRGLYDGVVWN